MCNLERRSEAGADPIVSEVRRVREALFAESGCDLERFVQRLREEQSTSGRPVVTRLPKRIPHRSQHAT